MTTGHRKPPCRVCDAREHMVRVADEHGERAQRPLAVVLGEPPAQRRRRVPTSNCAAEAGHLSGTPHHVEAREVDQDPVHRGGGLGLVRGLDMLGELAGGQSGGSRAERVEEAELDGRPEDQGVVVCEHEFLRLQADLVLLIWSTIRNMSFLSRERGSVFHGSNTSVRCWIYGTDNSECLHIYTHRES